MSPDGIVVDDHQDRCHGSSIGLEPDAFDC